MNRPQTRNGKENSGEVPGINLEIERKWLQKLVPGYRGDGELHRIGGEATAIRKKWWQPSFDFLEDYYKIGYATVESIQKLPSFSLQKNKRREKVPSGAGIYFAFQDETLVYIGVAAMISSRVTSSHHKLKLALKEGKALLIHYFLVTHHNYRNLPTIERELIESFAPRLNTHHAGHKKQRKRERQNFASDQKSACLSSNLRIELDDPFLDALKKHASERGIEPERLAQKLLRQAINMLEN